MKMKFQSSNESMGSLVNVAFAQTSGSQVWWKQNVISEYYTSKPCSRKLLLKRMKMKKVIRLIFLFATIKPMVSLSTYPFHVITNYFSIRKNRVTKEPSGKGYERTRKIAVLAKKKAVEKSKISNYKFQTRFKTKPTPVIQIVTKTQLKRPTFHHMKVSQTIKTRRKNHTHCQNARSNLIWVTKALTGKPVNYALIVRTTVSKTLFAKNV